MYKRTRGPQNPAYRDRYKTDWQPDDVVRKSMKKASATGDSPTEASAKETLVWLADGVTLHRTNQRKNSR